jgi:sulfate/thiosulfate transport system substrate-binding protein
MERGPFERPSERVARKGGARWGALGARLWDLGALSAIGLAALAIASNRVDRFGKSGTLLNVSYDATRKAYDDLDAAFANDHEARHGQSVAITLSHGGSSAQARKVAEGLEADVVTLALSSDVDLLRRSGLVADGWAERLPNHSQPYHSTIVFVVRRGNPRHIADWTDLVRANVGVVTPNPKTSGSGKLAFLAAWGSVIRRGGDDEAARAYVRALYEHVVALGSGAQTTAMEFVEERVGDVELAWENEALAQASASAGDLVVVAPPTSIRADPSVAWVDAYVARHGTEETARRYLEFLFLPAGQEILARDGYRPYLQDVLAAHAGRFAPIDLFPVDLVAKSWADAAERFFAEGGVYDSLTKRLP